MEEQQLEGGIANSGKVVRVGDHVLRPASPYAASIHAFLRAVRRVGFVGVPAPIGIEADGRERLEFVDGQVPIAYPAWCQTDEALASVARLLRGLHDASRGFDGRNLEWNATLADPMFDPMSDPMSDPMADAEGGALVCHNDVEPSNVVFRGGEAVALIDFEFAAPGRAVYDLAQLARLWVPLEDDFDQARMGWRPADRPARLRIVADAYGLDANGRAELLGAIDDALDLVEALGRHSFATGDPTTIAALNQIGGLEKYDRRRTWWTTHRPHFATALA